MCIFCFYCIILQRADLVGNVGGVNSVSNSLSTEGAAILPDLATAAFVSVSRHDAAYAVDYF